MYFKLSGTTGISMSYTAAGEIVTKIYQLLIQGFPPYKLQTNTNFMHRCL